MLAPTFAPAAATELISLAEVKLCPIAAFGSLPTCLIVTDTSLQDY